MWNYYRVYFKENLTICNGCKISIENLILICNPWLNIIMIVSLMRKLRKVENVVMDKFVNKSCPI